MSFIDTAFASPETAEATTAVSDSLLDSLGINGSGVIIQLINFIAVSLVIWFLILKPVTKKMTERQKMIDDSLKNAEEIEKRLTKSQIDYQARIDQAKMDTNKILEHATKEAEELKQSMKTEAAQEIEIFIEGARKKIQQEKEIVIKGIKEETAQLISLSLEKILSKKLNSETDKQLVEEMLDKIK
jgi:F-type H+-transporting ATPase subunit b